MKTFQILLTVVASLSLTSLSMADLIAYDFSGIRFTQTGSVSGGTSSSFTYESKTNNNTAVHSATFTLTDDFDGDSTQDSFSFDLVATATSGTVQSNGAGYTGVGNPRFSGTEELTYSIMLPSSVTLSGGGDGTVAFDGFTGGTMTDSTNYNYLVNTVVFTTTSFSAADTSTMVINANGQTNDIFSPGMSFGMTVNSVPEPSSAALLVFAGLAFLISRKSLPNA